MIEDGRLLLVDDDPQNLQRMKAALQSIDGSPIGVTSAADALEALRRRSGPYGFPGVIVTDLKMPDIDGIGLLQQVLKIDSDLPVIIVSAFGEISTAVAAMQLGAYDFMERPIDIDNFSTKITRALEKRALVIENRRLKAELATRSGLSSRLIGNSRSMQGLREQIAAIAGTDATALIVGDTGTGKEVVARALHELSPRSRARFVAVNCGGLSQSVIESELFGHEAGAFTDAKKLRIGLVEYARGGTLFLDEIESMPVALQVKLLRMLQERVITRLGSNEEIKVDIRVIAATKADLLKLADAGDFRADLYFRLGVAEIRIPPLNDRREDIPMLFEHFVQQFSNRYQRTTVDVTRADLEVLMAHNWRGNVRELRNFAERHVLGLTRPNGGVVSVTEGDDPQPRTLPEQIDAVESALIRSALKRHGDNVQAAADGLGIPRRTLNEKMRKYGIERNKHE